MAGNKIGGLKARDKNIAQNPNHYREIGKIGGRAKSPLKGFGADPERAKIAGAKGGRNRKGWRKLSTGN